jgi:hypothetical protein
MIFDRVIEASTSTGTGTITLDGAFGAYFTFNSVFTSGSKVYYCIEFGTEWETGEGTFTSPDQLSRDTVLSSSNSNSLVNFSSGTKRVFCYAPSQKGIFLRYDGTAIRPTIPLDSTGNYSVDLQLKKNNTTRIPLSERSVCIGGADNTVDRGGTAIGCENINRTQTTVSQYALYMSGRLTSTSATGVYIGFPGKVTAYSTSNFTMGDDVGPITNGFNFGKNQSPSLLSFLFGDSNSINGSSTITVGSNCSSGAANALTWGVGSTTNLSARMIRSLGGFAANNDNRYAYTLFRGTTTNATPLVLLAGGTGTFAPANNNLYYVNAQVISRSTTGDNAIFFFKFVIRRNTTNASLAILGTSSKEIYHRDVASWDADINVDTSNGRFGIQVTGAASTTIRWVAIYRAIEVNT